MSKILAAIGRKFLSLALMFNSVVSLILTANMLSVFYVNMGEWRPYSPYLIEGSLLWFIIPMAVLNIGPAKLIGKVRIKRVLFHHYVYGFLASSVSLMLTAVFEPAYLFLLLVPSLGFQSGGFQTLLAYTGLFFVYGGITLVIDDINDVSLRVARNLDRLKARVRKSGRVVHAVHLASSLVSIYVLICGVLWYLENSFWMGSWPLWDASQVIFLSNLFVTSLWGLKAVKERLWFTKSPQ